MSPLLLLYSLFFSSFFFLPLWRRHLRTLTYEFGIGGRREIIRSKVQFSPPHNRASWRNEDSTQSATVLRKEQRWNDDTHADALSLWLRPLVRFACCTPSPNGTGRPQRCLFCFSPPRSPPLRSLGKYAAFFIDAARSASP